MKSFEPVKEDTLMLWWTTREIAKNNLNLTLLGTIIRILAKFHFIIIFKQLGTKHRFALRLLKPFYEYNQYIAEVRKMKRDNSQRRNDVSMELANQQSDWVDVYKCK